MFANLIEAWRTVMADRLFPGVHPTATLVARMADEPDPLDRKVAFDVHDKIARTALEVAIGHIGSGETGGNNVGPFVEKCVWPAKTPQNWCAGFVGVCYEQAAARLGIPLPFKRSLGARRLGANVAAVGRKFTDPAEAKPGDLAIWHRGGAGSWMGHVAVVERACDHDEHGGHPWIDVIEGNSGPMVRRSTRHPTDPRERFAFFASLRR